jgi:nucleotide-binding universal stress UspA family protein
MRSAVYPSPTTITIELPSYTTMMACTDFSSLGTLSIETAIQLGEVFNAQRVHVAHVSPVLSSARDLVGAGDPNMDALERLETPLSQIPMMTRQAYYGPPAKTLALVAGEIAADLVIAGAQGSSPIPRMSPGTVLRELVCLSPSQVLVVGEDQARPLRFRDVLAAIDLSRISHKVLTAAAGMAMPFDGRVRALTVFGRGASSPRPSAKVQEILQREAMNELIDKCTIGGAQISPEVIIDEDVDRGIRTAVKDQAPDLIVLGTGGSETWKAMMLGSTASRILTWAKCPVLIVPHEGV